jgi:S-formylglutathione hydrolase FrmB
MTTALLFLSFLLDLPGCRPVSGDRIFECAKGADNPYTLVLPAGYSADRAWPALLILHGLGRTHMTLVEDAETRESLLRSRSVLVLPEGGRTWWRDEAKVLRLLDSLTAQLHLDPRRIGCTGWSMGGYGSLRIATHHPERFAAWAGIIGLVDFPNPSYAPADNHSVPDVFGKPEEWAAANPLADVERLRGKAIWFGTGESAFDAAMNRTLDRTLEHLNIDHTFEVVPGKHEFRVVAELLTRVITFFDSAMRNQ